MLPLIKEAEVLQATVIEMQVELQPLRAMEQTEITEIGEVNSSCYARTISQPSKGVHGNYCAHL